MNESGRIAGFRCVFRTSISEYNDAGLYVTEYLGELFVALEGKGADDSEWPSAGTTRLFVVNADAAENDDQDLSVLLDCRAETAALLPLLGEEAGNFSPVVCQLLKEEMVTSNNVLLLDRLEIQVRFRGQELGIRFINAAVTAFGIGCRLAVIKPFPLQFEGKGDSKGMRSATTRLKRYYARAGFTPVQGSELMIRDLQKL